MSRSEAQRLDDVLAAVSAIRRAERLAKDVGSDECDEVVVAAVQYWVFVIGEAVKALSDETRARRPQVPWSDVARMRDLIGHHYYKLDAEIVRATIGVPLAQLEAACVELREENGAGSRA